MYEKKVKEVIEYVLKMVEIAKEVSESTGCIVHKERYEKLKIILEALEKQLSKNILISGNSGMQTCPVCRKFMGFKNDEEEKEKYCNNCGQKLDWSE